ncbi:hypothetical protein K7432_014558, partial [Basidiobolus ranarum]
MKVMRIVFCGAFGLFISQVALSQSFRKQHVLQSTSDGCREGEDCWSNTVLDILKRDRRFSRVLDILTSESSRSDHLTTPRAQITFFAPTNTAISKFLDENDEGDVDEEKKLFQLRKLLKYHTVPGNLLYRKLRTTRVLKTIAKEDELNGKYQRIKISEEDNNLKLNEDVIVDEVDLRASNGVVHVIQSLLREPSIITDTLVEYPSKFSALNLALQKTGLNRNLETARGITLLAPSNLAFRNLGCKNLKHLFSQNGKKDLEKIIKHHLSPMLAYSSSFKHFEYHQHGKAISEVPEHSELVQALKKRNHIVCR